MISLPCFAFLGRLQSPLLQFHLLPRVSCPICVAIWCNSVLRYGHLLEESTLSVVISQVLGAPLIYLTVIHNTTYMLAIGFNVVHVFIRPPFLHKQPTIFSQSLQTLQKIYLGLVLSEVFGCF